MRIGNCVSWLEDNHPTVKVLINECESCKMLDCTKCNGNSTGLIIRQIELIRVGIGRMVGAIHSSRGG